MFENKKSLFLDFVETNTRFDEDRKNYSAESLIKYPVTFLSDCLLGIMPNELTVIGADTGCGKSFLANELAVTASQAGKRVYLFSLEGDRNEFVLRIRWNHICRNYYSGGTGKTPIRIQDYFLNRLDEIAPLDLKAHAWSLDACKNLKIFSRDVQLEKNVLIEQLARINDADLIIIDHLHYLPFSEPETEHMQISETMRLVQHITKIKKVPIVMISHLRKKSKERVLPDNEDFYGSSTIAKEADTCITIAPDLSGQNEVTRPTFFRVTKSRTGADTQYIGKMYFNKRMQTYTRDYYLMQISGKELVHVMPQDIPFWAIHAKINSSQGIGPSSSENY